MKKSQRLLQDKSIYGRQTADLFTQELAAKTSLDGLQVDIGKADAMDNGGFVLNIAIDRYDKEAGIYIVARWRRTIVQKTWPQGRSSGVGVVEKC